MAGTIEEETERLADAVEALNILVSAGNAQLAAIVAAIESITVNVNVTQGDVAEAIFNTGGPQPLTEQQAIKKTITAKTTGLRSPKIPGR
jgi:hypothetical protein